MQIPRLSSSSFIHSIPSAKIAKKEFQTRNFNCFSCFSKLLEKKLPSFNNNCPYIATRLTKEQAAEACKKDFALYILKKDHERMHGPEIKFVEPSHEELLEICKKIPDRGDDPSDI